MRARAFLAAAAAFVLAAGVSAASPQVDWKALKYFHYDLSGSELYLSTDKGWHGRVVKPLVPFPLGLVPRWALDAKRAPQSLWVPTCTKARQVAVLSFPFQAPGPAKTGSVVIATAAASSPVETVSISVNGREVARNDSYLRTRGYSEVTLDAQDLKKFRYGSNTIVVRATKAALPKGVTTCKGVGVAVGLRATFLADVRAEPVAVFTGYKVVTTAERSRRVYIKAVPGKSVAVNSNLRVRNAGPAASVEGSMILDFRGDTSLRLLVAGGEGSPLPAPGGDPPFGTCTIDNPNPFRYFTVTCPYRDFPPNRDAILKVTWIVRVDDQLASNFSQRTVILDYRIGGIDDDRTVNGMARLELVFCGQFASDPGCAAAQ